MVTPLASRGRPKAKQVFRPEGVQPGGAAPGLGPPGAYLGVVYHRGRSLVVYFRVFWAVLREYYMVL